MNVKKRPRLELTTAATATDVALVSSSYGNGNANGNIAITTGAGTATATASANGLFLASSIGVGGVDMKNGAQIYLTICGDDDNSDESQEFYTIESIKQEPELDALHALLPTSLQLPTGCEIYLVKDTTIGPAPGNGHINAPSASPEINEQLQQLQKHSQSMASIKLEPDSISTPSTNVLFVSGSGTTATHNIVVAASQESPSSSSSIAVANHASQTASQAAAPANHCTTGYNVKLDAYKKRDDKRRATHNEVERRRRDKINCWIFKLKEMLPTEGNRYKPTNVNVNANANVNVNGNPPETMDSKTTIRSSHNNGRTPPNDSKSQILIKACDYIKSMQNEIDNLRECLREAENLRFSNQALRNELEILKQQQELQERYTAGGSFNVTLNSLNSSATSDLFDGIDAAPNLSTVSSINFTKRGLMIADYDE